MKNNKSNQWKRVLKNNNKEKRVKRSSKKKQVHNSRMNNRKEKTNNQRNKINSRVMIKKIKIKLFHKQKIKNNLNNKNNKQFLIKLLKNNTQMQTTINQKPKINFKDQRNQLTNRIQIMNNDNNSQNLQSYPNKLPPKNNKTNLKVNHNMKEKNYLFKN